MGSVSGLSSLVKRLEGKVAVITGGCGCLGSMTARLFQEHGAKVLVADIKHDPPDHPSCENFIHCDVTKESDVKNVVNRAVSIHGRLDIMFNNAALLDPIGSDIVNYDQAEFEHVLRVNIMGTFLGTKHAARVMKSARRGSIINTASVCSFFGGVATHAYTSSKHGVLGLTRNTAAELGKFGIRVNCVSPYAFPSPMSRRALNRADDDPMDDIYSGLKGVTLKAQDVAEAVVYLASDESKYVSGHNLVVDGGYTLVNSAFTAFRDE